MIITSPRFKLFFGYVITALNIALPVFVLYSSIRGMPFMQEQFTRWYPVQPIFTVLNHVLLYAIELIWYWFLYKNRKKFSSLKILSVSLLVILGFLAHGLVTAVIQEQRLFLF